MIRMKASHKNFVKTQLELLKREKKKQTYNSPANYYKHHATVDLRVAHISHNLCLLVNCPHKWHPATFWPWPESSINRRHYLLQKSRDRERVMGVFRSHCFWWLVVFFIAFAMMATNVIPVSGTTTTLLFSYDSTRNFNPEVLKFHSKWIFSMIPEFLFLFLFFFFWTKVF